jgi:hypothetical protein
MNFEFKILDWLWAVGIGWASYMHTRVHSLPSREELSLQQEVNNERHDEVKEDLARLERKIDKLFDMVSDL